MFHSIDISASGLIAQRQRMDTIAGNIANSSSTQSENGEIKPFQRRLVVMQAAGGSDATQGVGVTADVEIDTQSPPRLVHQPGHPHANADGYVSYPNVNIVTEFVNALEASRAYDANVTTMEVTKDMIQSTFKIIA